jgi:hypothetical protein
VWGAERASEDVGQSVQFQLEGMSSSDHSVANRGNNNNVYFKIAKRGFKIFL